MLMISSLLVILQFFFNLLLRQIFELKDLGDLHFFLGLHIHRSPKGLSINQGKYITDLLTKHNMLNSKPAKTPCVPHVRLVPDEGYVLPDPRVYHSLVGSLHYLTFTRLNLSFVVHQVCQFMSFPTDIHLVATKCILRYLVGTQHVGVLLLPGPFSLLAFSNSDSAGDPHDRRSTTSFIMYLGYNLITWSAKKQITASKSSTESEYCALASTATELCWIRQVLRDLDIYLAIPPKIWYDNVFALAIASNTIFHARTKHIEVDYHFIKERVLRRDLRIKYISMDDQFTDIFTKSFPTYCFQILYSKILFTMVPKVLRGDEDKIKE